MLDFNNNFVNCAADVAVIMSDISQFCTGTLTCVCLYIEINNKQTRWQSFTEVALWVKY